MNVLLMPIGSAGDVHPFVGLGLALQRRGHRVTVITNPYLEATVREAGLEFEPLGTVEEFVATLKNPDLWTAHKSFHLVAELGMLGPMRQAYEILARLYVPGETVAAAGSLALGARIAQDKLGLPLVTVHLQPSVFASAYHAPVVPGMPLPDWLPRWVKRAAFRMADRYIDSILAPRLNAFREELGLPPVRRIFGEWLHSPQRVLGLFPAWFGPPQPDWPPQTVLTGFPLYDESNVRPLPADLDGWLAEGTPPLVFTPGSAMQHGQAFFSAAVEACRLLKRRGLLLTRFREQIPAELPPDVRHMDYAPFSQVLPRSAALIYHGGVGTSAQGLAAGIPLLVMPMGHDQPDNADRLRRLGVGLSLKPSAFRGPAVARLLDRLLTSAQVANRCRELAQRIREDRPVEQSCVVLEKMLTANGSHTSPQRQQE